MNAIRGAILAGLCPVLWSAAAGPLPEPLHVRFHLADGVQVSGEMTLWDAEGIDGTFGRRQWQELATDDIWRLYRRVMDPEVADQWVDLGRVLLLVPDGKPWAERAFDRAIRLSPDHEAAIIAARVEAAEVIEERNKRIEEAAAHRLRTRTPEAGEFGSVPWPVLGEREHDQALDAARQEAADIVRAAGLSLVRLETPDFVVYSDVERLDAARWTVALDGIARRLKVLFGLGEIERVFWGKAVVFLFREQDRFALMEADTFGQLVPRKAIALFHPRDERAFITAYRADDDEALLGALVHETVHAFMHRYRTPKRLPPWANEGLAEYVAGQVLPESDRTRERRRAALEFIRGGGDVAALLAATYQEETWPERSEQAETVGALLVELMITQKPRRFGAWIDAVKFGADWQEALADEFGTSTRQFLETAVLYYRVND